MCGLAYSEVFQLSINLNVDDNSYLFLVGCKDTNYCLRSVRILLKILCRLAKSKYHIQPLCLSERLSSI